MSSSKAFSGTEKRSEARDAIKSAAIRLFAERGYRNVTVRDIAREAGQKNHAAVGYYFASKENLARELLVDGAMIIEGRRNAMLDELEALGSPPSIRQLVEALMLPIVEVHLDYAKGERYFSRFTQDMGFNEPVIFEEALAGRWNRGYQRCLAHLRSRMPDRTATEANRRLIFLGVYLTTMSALLESRASGQGGSTWSAASTLQDIITTAIAIIEA